MKTKKPCVPHVRPENPFTPKVMECIRVNTEKILKRFNDFANTEKRENRRGEITSRLNGAVMKAHEKFSPDRGCSFDTFADLFIVREASHYVRDAGRALKKERATVSGDARIDDTDDDSPSYLDGLASNRDHVAEMRAKMDYMTLLAVLRQKNPVYVKVIRLVRDGYKFSEIHRLTGIEEWRIYDVIWPAIKTIARQILGEEM